MKCILMLVNSMAFEVSRDSYDHFCKHRDDPDMLFHDFRDVRGVIHTVAKMSILSVALESGIAVHMK